MIEMEPQPEHEGRVQRSRHKRMCPYCGERVPTDAVKCRYCGEFLDRPVRRYQAPPKRTSTCLVVILVGIAVLVFLGVISAIAIPSLVESKLAANEASAISCLRVISSSQELFYTRYDRYGTLNELETMNIIDPALAAATRPGKARRGYYYRLTAGHNEWSCTAMPAEPGKTGARSFFINDVGVIYYRSCTSRSDPPADETGSMLGGFYGGG
jgi:type II secretory pathway pseudopilin PulG/ribosomal protein L40E